MADNHTLKIASVTHVLELDHRPSQHGSGPGHGQVELYIVTSIVPAAADITAAGGAVVDARVAAPGDAVVGRKLPAALGLVEQPGQAQDVGVIGVTCGMGVYA